MSRRLEEVLDAPPPWVETKRFWTTLKEKRGVELELCGCRLFRASDYDPATCVCEHDVLMHEEGKRCWRQPVMVNRLPPGMIHVDDEAYEDDE